MNFTITRRELEDFLNWLDEALAEPRANKRKLWRDADHWFFENPPEIGDDTAHAARRMGEIRIRHGL